MTINSLGDTFLPHPVESTSRLVFNDAAVSPDFQQTFTRPTYMYLWHLCKNMAL